MVESPNSCADAGAVTVQADSITGLHWFELYRHSCDTILFPLFMGLVEPGIQVRVGEAVLVGTWGMICLLPLECHVAFPRASWVVAWGSYSYNLSNRAWAVEL